MPERPAIAPYFIPAKPNGLSVERPNIVIFMPDQLRYDALGCCGNSFAKTPNIDRLASRGTRFTNCFVQASVCSQSRCSMFTGNYPHVSGHRSLDNLIKPWEPNMFRSLKESGYHVACLAPRGDTWAPEATELALDEYGFLETPNVVPKFASGKPDDCDQNDIWNRLFYKGLRDDSRDYDNAVVRSALTWLERPPTDKPWVLFMPLIFPHCPFQVEEPYFSLHDRSLMPRPTLPEMKSGYEPRYMQANRDRYGTHRATPEIWAEIQATYHGMISRLDAQLGSIMNKIDSMSLWCKTVTMFFTDHGEYLGDHGLIEKWPSGLSDSLTHEPLIIAGAGLPEGQMNEEMTEMVDLLPTVLQLCGVAETFPHCGLSLLPTMTSGSKHKDYSYTEGGFLVSEEPLLEQAPFPYDIKAALQHEDTELVGKSISCRDKSWTYIYRLYEPPELYDRVNDIGELKNLADEEEYKVVRDKMEKIVLKWLVGSSDFLPYVRDPRFPKVALESPQTLWEKRACREQDARTTVEVGG